MKYNDYDVERFLTDPDFIQWAKGAGEDKAYFFNKWLSTNPENRQKAELAREILIRMQSHQLEPAPQEFEDVLEAILRNTHKTENKRWFTLPVYRWAAVFLALAAGLAIFYSVSRADKLIVASNPPGQKSIIILPDGSKVNLNADSELKYPSDFGARSRNLELKGEAFFDVAHNAEIPFRVKSGDLTAQVSGTSFNIRNFNNSPIQISLLTGSLAVSQLNAASAGQTVLQPGDRITQVNGDLVKDHFAPEEIGWKDGVLCFKEASFTSVRETLQRWYGISIQVVNAPRDGWHYSGTFENYDLTKVLYRMSYTENFEFTIEGKHVTVTFPEDHN
jgi:transmembrane sensor